jgi:phosphoribosylformimino-5-aminoimidazole carboxamide ribotide isomerase
MRLRGFTQGGDRVILYPAIDILEGNAVRLVKGDFEAKKVYDKEPIAAARSWTEEGARFLHVVDLDGAREGRPVNLEHLRRISGELGVPVQYGGGLRSTEAVSEALNAGAARVILGTAAFADPEFLAAVVAEWPDRLLVSVDVRGGRLTTSGWTETSEITTAKIVKSLHERGVRNLVYTNVDRDGMLEGPDLEEVREVAETVRGRFLYSGGIGQLADLQALADMHQPNLAGVIVGKALYEKRFTVAQAQAVLGS